VHHRIIETVNKLKHYIIFLWICWTWSCAIWKISIY